MQTKFKRHQRIILLITPNTEYLEYAPDVSAVPIKKGMSGIINLILPNGKYHVAILNKEGEVIAYVPLDEEQIGAE